VRERLAMLAIITLALSGASGASLADETLRDPTRPYVVRERVVIAVPRYQVNTIIVSADRRVAIVNGQRVVVGGSVNGAKVISIEKTHLILEKNGKHVTATLKNRASGN